MYDHMFFAYKCLCEQTEDATLNLECSRISHLL